MIAQEVLCGRCPLVRRFHPKTFSRVKDQFFFFVLRLRPRGKMWYIRNMENYEVCSGPECERRVDIFKHGLCSGHYQQKYHGRELSPLKSQAPVEKCPVNSCIRGQKTRGLCVPHASIAWRMSIHPADLPALLNGASCEICGDDQNLHLDHDHKCCPENMSCGECLRGVLCSTCNVAVGHLEKMIRRSGEKSVEYLANPPGVHRTREYEPATVDNHPGRGRR